MSKDVYYFKHDANADDDMKCKALRRKHKWQGMGWLWHIVGKLRNEEDYHLPYDDLTFSGLSEDFSCTPEEVKSFIDDCINLRLFTSKDGYFCSSRLNRDMAHFDNIRQIRKQARQVGIDKSHGLKPKEKEATPKQELELNPHVAKMVSLYEEKTGKTLTPSDAEVLKDIEKNYTPENYEKALDEAVNNKARSPMKYMAKILETWKQEQEPKRRTYSDEKEGMTEL